MIKSSTSFIDILLNYFVFIQSQKNMHGPTYVCTYMYTPSFFRWVAKHTHWSDGIIVVVFYINNTHLTWLNKAWRYTHSWVKLSSATEAWPSTTNNVNVYKLIVYKKTL